MQGGEPLGNFPVRAFGHRCQLTNPASRKSMDTMLASTRSGCRCTDLRGRDEVISNVVQPPAP